MNLERMEEQMHNRRNNVLNELQKIVHPKYVEEFSKLLHYSWQENLPEAEKIAESLNLFPIDFCALSFDIKEFTHLFFKEQEDLQGEDDFIRLYEVI